jgi:hypothetical protein
MCAGAHSAGCVRQEKEVAGYRAATGATADPPDFTALARGGAMTLVASATSSRLRFRGGRGNSAVAPEEASSTNICEPTASNWSAIQSIIIWFAFCHQSIQRTGSSDDPITRRWRRHTLLAAGLGRNAWYVPSSCRKKKSPTEPSGRCASTRTQRLRLEPVRLNRVTPIGVAAVCVSHCSTSERRDLSAAFIRSSFSLVAVGSALPSGTRLDAPPAARNVVASCD